jgi:hypothetical protein
MEFSKLSQNEKLAVYGSVAVLIGGLVGYSYGLTILAVLAAVAMLAVVFLPQMSASTNLPGSRGSLMLLLGGVAGVILLLALVLYIGVVFTAFGIRDLFFLIAVAGGLLMAWVGWQEFQSEGGKFQLGSSSATAPPPAASQSPTPSEPAGTAQPPGAPSEPPAPSSPPEPPRDVYDPPAPAAPPEAPAPAERDSEDRPTP